LALVFATTVSRSITFSFEGVICLEPEQIAQNWSNKNIIVGQIMTRFHGFLFTSDLWAEQFVWNLMCFQSCWNCTGVSI
jgi:hypothetical protein